MTKKGDTKFNDIVTGVVGSDYDYDKTTIKVKVVPRVIIDVSRK